MKHGVKLLVCVALIHCGCALRPATRSHPATRLSRALQSSARSSCMMMMTSPDQDPLSDVSPDPAPSGGFVPPGAPPPAGFGGEGFTNYLLPYAGMTVLAFGLAFGSFYAVVASST